VVFLTKDTVRIPEGNTFLSGESYSSNRKREQEQKQDSRQYESRSGNRISDKDRDSSCNKVKLKQNHPWESVGMFLESRFSPLSLGSGFTPRCIGRS
jgi:hypothetical protein